MSTQHPIYLNNAGTSWPKPASVDEAVARVAATPPSGWAAEYERAHRQICAFLEVPEPHRLLLTSGCTSSLAVSLTGLPLRDGDRLLTSSLEHHALARWLVHLHRTRGIQTTAVPYRTGQPLDLDFVRDELRAGGVRWVACSMASNVTGELLPVRELCDLAHQHGARVLIDGAQTAGLMPIALSSLGADIFVFAGHKGPLGPHGVGGLYAAPDVCFATVPATCDVPDAAEAKVACELFPSFCDVGSVNLSAACGLAAGVQWLAEQGVAQMRDHVRELVGQLLEGLQGLRATREALTIHGVADPARRAAAISITVRRARPALLERRLQQRGVIARGGMHCAPAAHRALGTEAGGTLRFSPGPFNDRHEMTTVVGALEDALSVDLDGCS